MSVCCGVECVVAIGCLRWAWKRCTYIGGYDSATWPPASPDEFSPVPRLCRLILAIYDPDLKTNPTNNFDLNPSHVIKHVTYPKQQQQQVPSPIIMSPPYLIYLDHSHREIVLAIRGLNLINTNDYKLLLDNKLGMQKFDGGYVHHGLLKSAAWLLNQEADTIRDLWLHNGSSYKIVFVGHSLGSGIAALLAIIVVNHRDKLGGVPRRLISCYCIAPARCMSLNLAVKYADIINSVVLQDDFLPRTPTPLQDIFTSVFCLPCLLFLICLRDTFIPEGRKLRDPRRLYAPGRMYHIVERKFCRCGRFPPEVRTAIPVDGRFEHIVLSCSTTSDHAIVWIEREAKKALELMKERNAETVTTAPEVQKIERLHTFEKEHKDALERAVSLNIPDAVTNLEEPSEDTEEGSSSRDMDIESQDASKGAPQPKSESSRVNWNEVVGLLFDKSESGKLELRKDVAAASK